MHISSEFLNPWWCLILKLLSSPHSLSLATKSWSWSLSLSSSHCIFSNERVWSTSRVLRLQFKAIQTKTQVPQPNKMQASFFAELSFAQKVKTFQICFETYIFQIKCLQTINKSSRTTLKCRHAFIKTFKSGLSKFGVKPNFIQTKKSSKQKLI